MISETKYLKAKEIVEQYEKQLEISLKKQDLNLIDHLPKATARWLIDYNKTADFPLVTISDFLELIKWRKSTGYYRVPSNHKSRHKYFYLQYLRRFRGFGIKKHDDIMDFVKPYLHTVI